MSEVEPSDDWYEKQCSPSYWSNKHPNREEVINHYVTFCTSKSKQTLEEATTDLNISYGVSCRQKIDYFYCTKSREKSNNQPVFVYIHGGYWQEGDKELHRFVTSVFTKYNFNCAVVGYDIAPNVTILQIMTQITEAIEAVYNHFNQSQLIVCGHSAGAFLTAAVSLARPSMIRDIVLISGVYEFLPLLHTSYNEPLKLTIEQAEELNLILADYTYNANITVHIYVGEDESPWFIKQSETCYEKLSEKQVPCTFKVVPNEDHFSIIENLFDEASVVCGDILKLNSS